MNKSQRISVTICQEKSKRFRFQLFCTKNIKKGVLLYIFGRWKHQHLHYPSSRNAFLLHLAILQGPNPQGLGPRMAKPGGRAKCSRTNGRNVGRHVFYFAATETQSQEMVMELQLRFFHILCNVTTFLAVWVLPWLYIYPPGLVAPKDSGVSHRVLKLLG